jgi:hypothetical protein
MESTKPNRRRNGPQLPLNSNAPGPAWGILVVIVATLSLLPGAGQVSFLSNRVELPGNPGWRRNLLRFQSVTAHFGLDAVRCAGQPRADLAGVPSSAGGSPAVVAHDGLREHLRLHQDFELLEATRLEGLVAVEESTPRAATSRRRRRWSRLVSAAIFVIGLAAAFGPARRGPCRGRRPSRLCPRKRQGDSRTLARPATVIALQSACLHHDHRLRLAAGGIGSPRSAADRALRSVLQRTRGRGKRHLNLLVLHLDEGEGRPGRFHIAGSWVCFWTRSRNGSRCP